MPAHCPLQPQRLAAGAHPRSRQPRETSRPLPDIPLFEEHRAPDPVTAEHERRIGRPERYWRDMDDATWDARAMKNLARVNAYDITGRLNLMARHVLYAD